MVQPDAKCPHVRCPNVHPAQSKIFSGLELLAYKAAGCVMRIFPSSIKRAYGIVKK